MYAIKGKSLSKVCVCVCGIVCAITSLAFNPFFRLVAAKFGTFLGCAQSLSFYLTLPHLNPSLRAEKDSVQFEKSFSTDKLYCSESCFTCSEMRLSILFVVAVCQFVSCQDNYDYDIPQESSHADYYPQENSQIDYSYDYEDYENDQDFLSESNIDLDADYREQQVEMAKQEIMKKVLDNELDENSISNDENGDNDKDTKDLDNFENDHSEQDDVYETQLESDIGHTPTQSSYNEGDEESAHNTDTKDEEISEED